MRVKDKFRKNPLSFQPGGHEVTIVFSDGFSLVYDKIKYPMPFIRKISDKNKSKKIVSIFIDGESNNSFLPRN